MHSPAGLPVKGTAVVTSSGAGLASFPGKTTRTAYLRNLVFSTNEDDENRYERGGVTGSNGILEEGPEEGCGPMRMRGREEGGDEGVALDQIHVVLRPLGTDQPCILAPEKCWQVVFTLITQKEALFPQKLSV